MSDKVVKAAALTMEDQVKHLIEMAGIAYDPIHAMQFSQAALNVANAMCSLCNAKSMGSR